MQRAGFTQAKLVLVSMPNMNEVLRVLRYKRPEGLPVVVRVFEEEDANAIERLGGIAVLNSRAAAEAFMTWFEASG